jgi:hypothetical protein
MELSSGSKKASLRNSLLNFWGKIERCYTDTQSMKVVLGIERPGFKFMFVPLEVLTSSFHLSRLVSVTVCILFLLVGLEFELRVSCLQSSHSTA